MTTQLMVKMVLDTWNSKIKEADKLFAGLSDEALQKEVAPGRNRGIYLLGHLAAVNDKLVPLLGLGERKFADLDESFLNKPDRSTEFSVSANELRQMWKSTNESLSGYFAKMQPEEWFQKHSSVSAEDFAKEPHRNKLNVLISRTNHLSSHIGQLLFLVNKN